MKKRSMSFAAGLLVGAVIFGGTTAYAAGILAERSTHPIYVDGQQVQMEAYNINGQNYVKLRDIGQAVGYNVYWDGAVQIESNQPYTGTAPDSGSSSEQAASTGAAQSRNADGSINVPSDGSQYVPQAGDVVRCDDGTNYTITDVSRYNKNMFANGPLVKLPEPTCDWSQMPQPELPEAEVRHFQLESGDYMFIRNLYETRRMLYTLYNAIGANSETWRNGSLALHPSGNPKVRISLTIPDNVQAESFWPWRENQIVDPFNADPCGTHCLEAWDVYKDGIFQRTQYNIYAI